MHKKNVTKPPKKKVSPEDVLINAEFMTALALELMLRETERIRKNCIHFLELQKVHHADTSEIDDCIAYLERQKEQKPVQSDVEKEYVRILKSIVCDFIRDKEPKGTLLYQDIFDWLEGRHIENPSKSVGLKEQKPAERSLEDDHIIGLERDGDYRLTPGRDRERPWEATDGGKDRTSPRAPDRTRGHHDQQK